MSVVPHPDGGSSCPAPSAPLVQLLFTAPANAYSLLTPGLQVWFDWHFVADDKSDDRLSVQRAARVVVVASACRSGSMLSAPAQRPELCAAVLVQTPH